MRQQIIDCLNGHRFPLHDEIELHKEMANALAAANISFRREVKLGPYERIDFLCGNIGIEVKIKGVAKRIYKQCEGYCQHDEIKEFILVTNRSMGFPESLNGKPCYVVRLGRSWL